MAAHIIGSIGGTQADSVPIKRALLSVSDKTGLVELGKALAAKNVELLSTGGTAKALRAAGLTVQDVADYTGFPEMLGGRVKTLHPKVHGGIMYVRGNAEHEASVKEAGIKGIDLVVLNLYAFEATVAKGSDFETCVENVDIGGPSMLRSSAKNHRYVTIATAPSQYAELIAALNKDGCTPYSLRKKFAAAAFAASLSSQSHAGLAPLAARTMLAPCGSTIASVKEMWRRCDGSSPCALHQQTTSTPITSRIEQKMNTLAAPASGAGASVGDGVGAVGIASPGVQSATR